VENDNIIFGIETKVLSLTSLVCHTGQYTIEVRREDLCLDEVLFFVYQHNQFSGELGL
jgi:hypothetical protein